MRPSFSSQSSGSAGETELLLLYARQDANEDEPGEENSRPELDFEDSEIIGSLRCGADRGQQQDQNGITAPPVILPDPLGLLFSAVQGGNLPHGESDKILRQQDDDTDEAHPAVGRVEMRTIGTKLVVLDDDNTCQKRDERSCVDRCVDNLTNLFLLRGMGRLDEQNRLDEEQDAQGLGQWVAGEEDELVEKDAGPDQSKEYEDAKLRNDSGAL